MKIRALLEGSEPVYSFEFFPPKTAEGEQQLFATIEQLKPVAPAFVSVTYGAGGHTRGKTVELAARIKHDIGLESMAHLTCVGASRAEIATVLRQLRDAGIENVLPLRGDPPRDQPAFVAPMDGFAHASDLAAFIRAEGFDFCLAGAGYPEGHPDSENLEADMRHLKCKVDSGVELIITQLFFDNASFHDFVARARRAGIAVPILPGIMPITDFAQIQRIAALCGSRIPDALQRKLESVAADPAAVRAIGVDHATDQCRDLLAAGVPGIHFYTLNRSMATRAIVRRLREGN